MSTTISNLSHIDPRAQIGDNVEIGPFCSIGPHVKLADGNKLDSHVSIAGHTTIGEDNRFFPNCVIGAEPQDMAYRNADTRLEIGNGNQFREGVTVNRGAQKEDHCTRIGDCNLLMANSHVAHNCNISSNVILVNGVLLGGHVHVHDGAIVSGNSVVHHFSTLGRLSFVSGGCRVPHDIPPFMLAARNDNPMIKTINIVGLRRAHISEDTIRAIKRAHRLVYREHNKVQAVRELLQHESDAAPPQELIELLDFVEHQQQGKLGRAREIYRDAPEASSGGRSEVVSETHQITAPHSSRSLNDRSSETQNQQSQRKAA